VPEPRALVKGSEEKRKTTVKVEKTTEESEIFFMYASLRERERDIFEGYEEGVSVSVNVVLCVATLDTRILSLELFQVDLSLNLLSYFSSYF